MTLDAHERDRLQQALATARQAHSALERLSETQLDAEHKRSLLERSAESIAMMEALLRCQDGSTP